MADTRLTAMVTDMDIRIIINLRTDDMAAVLEQRLFPAFLFPSQLRYDMAAFLVTCIIDKVHCQSVRVVSDFWFLLNAG